VSFSFTILGSSAAVPTSTRFPAAHGVNIHERFFLVDCGEGTQMQLRRNNIGFGKINHIFISHLHGDHTFGLFGLLSTFGLLDRKSELHIYANPLLKAILDEHHKHFYQHPFPYPVIFHPFGAARKQILYEDDRIEIQTIPLKHSIPCCGFLFREKPGLLNLRKELIGIHRIPVDEMMNIKKGQDFINESGERIPNKVLTHPPLRPRSMALLSDTSYTESIIPQIAETDILYHEATYMDDMRDRAAETGHSTAKQAGLLAGKARVGKLIIGHFSERYKTIDPLIMEARNEFPPTYAAREGDCHNVEPSRLPG
jgi:ribonuclease Z